MRRVSALLGALAGTAGAAGYFVGRRPMTVRVGRELIDARVPVAYQLSVFPAFGAFVGAWGHDRMRGRPDGGRAWLLAATGVVVATRLRGYHGLSGHVVFLAALLPRRDTPGGRGFAALGLAVAAPHKLRWGDVGGLVFSIAVGMLAGHTTRARREPHLRTRTVKRSS